MNDQVDDRAYYARRVRQELQMAENAKDLGARRTHLRFAEEYVRLLRLYPDTTDA